ncbi:MAG: hypothetical protein U9R74_18880 [Pseudomonadota bacterium]|nr:hypothetical protein [Pseudomonadota bacterium]
MLFLSSNPSISDAEIYPTWGWDAPALEDFFSNRFGGGEKEWMSEGVRTLQHDGTWSAAVMFWSSVRKRAREAFGRPVRPGIDYALTEIVHCKSRGEVGVREAAGECATRYLDRVLSHAAARVIVVLGDVARQAIETFYPAERASNNVRVVRIGERNRLLAYLPHPNARKVRTFPGVYSPDELAKIRGALGSATEQPPGPIGIRESSRFRHSTIEASRMTTGDETVQILRELQKLGFTDDEFRQMHHMGVSMAQHITYCAGKEFRQGSPNEILLMNLRRVLQRRKAND